MQMCIMLGRFVAFNHYRIPRENLLNKSADVTPEGKYVTPYKVSVCQSISSAKMPITPQLKELPRLKFVVELPQSCTSK